VEAATSDWDHVTVDYLWAELEPECEHLDANHRATILDALRVAYDAHDGQARRSGEPFIIHPVAVACILGGLRMDHETIVAGLLHDTVEDTDRVTFDSVETRFGAAVRRIVEGETKVSKISSKVSKSTVVDVDGSGTCDDGDDADTGGLAPITLRRRGEADGTDLANAEANAKAEVKAGDLQHMFITMTEEVRVIIVKLADRLHNMRTLKHLKPVKQRRIAKETLEVFAPLAKLLGMYKIKNELEDLAFYYFDTEAYQEIRRRFDELTGEQNDTVLEARKTLEDAFAADEYILATTERVEVRMVQKEPYSVWKKLNESEMEVASLRDIAQLRVILHLNKNANQSGAARACYHALGVVHSIWPPIPGRMKDYIATQKANGYQALHTFVMPLGSGAESSSGSGNGSLSGNGSFSASTSGNGGLDGSGGSSSGSSSSSASGNGINGAVGVPTEAGVLLNAEGNNRAVFPLELQIFTEEMHRTSECGIAADHAIMAMWQASAGEESVSAKDIARRVAWVNSIRQWQNEFLGDLTAREFVDTITGELLGKRVFVFTPQGKVINLPKGSSVVDYAYSIHSDVGNQMIGAKVNGIVVQPSHRVSNGEVVQILTYDQSSARKRMEFHIDMLKYVHTKSARHKLIKHMRKLERELGVESNADLVGGSIDDFDGLDVIDELVTAAGDPATKSAGGGGGPAAAAAARGGAAAAARGATQDDEEMELIAPNVALSLTCRDSDGLLAVVSESLSRAGFSIKSYSGHELGKGLFEMNFVLTMRRSETADSPPSEAAIRELAEQCVAQLQKADDSVMSFVMHTFGPSSSNRPVTGSVEQQMREIDRVPGVNGVAASNGNGNGTGTDGATAVTEAGEENKSRD